MTILTPSLLDTTRFQPGQAAGAIGSDDMRVLIDTLAGIGTSPNSPKNANYTAAANDYGCMLEFTGSGAQIYSIPLNASVAFDVGALLWACQVGSGTVTFAGVGGVTLRVPTSATTSKLYQIICVRQRAIDDWVVIFPFVSAGGGGGGGTSDLILPQSYGTIIDGGSFGDSLAHPASSNGFASLGAVQAVYPFATATSNDMAGLMIQAAINDAHARNLGETVFLPPGKFRNLPNGLTVPEFTSIQIRGSGWSSAILCQNCGTNPGISILQQNDSSVTGGREVLRNLALWGLNTYTINLHNTGGASNTSIFNAGSRGLWCQSAALSTFPGLEIVNFDLSTDWEGGAWTGTISTTTLTVSSPADGATITRGQFFQGAGVTPGSRVVDYISGTGGAGTYLITPSQTVASPVAMTGVGGNYIITFRDSALMFNNKGACINRTCFNSFEKMLWDNCNISGNNYNFFINFTDSLTPGGQPGAADAHIVNCSNDYGSVQLGTFLGGASAGGGDLICTLEILGGHMEVDTVAMGSGTRITNDGYINFDSVDCFEDGANVIGWVGPTGATCATKVSNCNLPGFNFPDTSAGCMPFIYSAGSMGYIEGGGNTNRIPFGALLGRDSNGDVSAFKNDTPLITFGLINTSQTLSLRHQPGKPITVLNTSTITLPASSVTNMAIGTEMPISVVSGATLTMAVSGGVNPLVGYSSPIVGPAARRLTTTATDTWMLV